MKIVLEEKGEMIKGKYSDNLIFTICLNTRYYFLLYFLLKNTASVLFHMCYWDLGVLFY